MFSVEEAQTLIDNVRDYFEEQKCDIKEDEKKYKVTLIFII